jgi:acetyl esterase/lipase
MKLVAFLLAAILLSFASSSIADALPPTKADIPYVASPDPLQKLDIYAPPNATNAPVVVWIHGGGWQTGDKTEVCEKPRLFTDKGMIFVSVNYRMLPQVDMLELFKDVAKSIGWVHAHIAEFGGDPNRLLLMGHSAGAQLAALMCADDRYLKAEGVPFSSLKGCVPVDGDTFDVPAIIETAETRRRVHGQPPRTNGHREKFGNHPAKHRDYSVVTHVAKDKGIPPFLVFYVAAQPDNTAQAQRLQSVLKDAGVPAKIYGARDTDHVKLNDRLGIEGDPPTKELMDFVAGVLKQ